MEKPDGDQRWQIVETKTWYENMVSRGNLCARSMNQRDSKLDQRPGLILDKEIVEAPENIKLSCGNEF